MAPDLVKHRTGGGEGGGADLASLQVISDLSDFNKIFWTYSVIKINYEKWEYQKCVL